MKIFYKLLLIYILFLIETAIVQPSLDLLLLGIVILSLHDSLTNSLIISLWAGFLLGLVSPTSFGFHITIMIIIAFACNNIKRFIYKYKVYFLTILFLSLLFKYLVSLIFLHGTPHFLSWLLSIAIILILAIPLESLITKIFYPPSIFQRE